jgi:hypothetical protein
MEHKRNCLVGLIVALSAMGWVSMQAEVRHHKMNSVNKIVYVSHEAWQPSDFEPGIVIPAHYLITHDIAVDGRDNDLEWRHAEEVIVPLLYGSVNKASLKALYTDDEVFIRVRWADKHEDRQHHPWTWDSKRGKYVPGPQVEDSLLLSFEAGCEWTPSLLGGYIYDFDGWHWMAARTDPLGQALDLYGNVQDREIRNAVSYPSRIRVDDWILKFTDHSEDRLHLGWDQLDRAYMLQPVTETLYVKIQPDGSRWPQQFVQVMAPPATMPYPHEERKTYPQFRPMKLAGGAAEVGARGRWSDGFWTVEFRRDRFTAAGYINDAKFDRLTQFSVHVFNRTERIDRVSESKRLFLHFLESDDSLVRNPVATD